MFSCSGKIVAVAVAVGWMIMAPATEAAVVGYWRFEDSPGFLSDSGPDGRTLTNVGSVVQYTLTGSGAGSDFPTIIPQTGASNTEAAQFSGTNLLTASDSPAFTSTTFSVEAFINGTNIGGGTRVIAGHWEGTINQERSWTFQTTGTGNLSLQISPLGTGGGGLSELVASTFVLNNNTDYYVAATIDLVDTSVSGITFYFQDLTAGGSLLSEGVGHTLTSVFDTPVPFTIGSTATPSAQLAGIIDEVRVSNTKLSQSQLLISVPEPSAVALASLGAIFLGYAAHRRRRGPSGSSMPLSR
jgi:hypothetical protein